MLDRTQLEKTAAAHIVRDKLTALVERRAFSPATIELHRALVARGMSFEGRRYAYNPSPLLIAKDDAEAICRRAEGLVKIIDKVATLYGSEAAVRAFFKTYASLEPVTMVDVPYRPIAHLNRFDIVWLGGDRFKVLEPNCCCPAGVTSNAITRRAWRSVRDFRDLVSEYDVVDYPIDDEATFARSLVDLAKQHGKAGAIALANYRGNFTFELDTIAAALRDQGADVVVADLKEFSYRNGRLCKDNIEISLVYNKLDQLMLRDGYDHLDYFEAYRRQAFVCVNSFRSQIILEDKAILAFLSDPEYASCFTPEERALIADHIPWTSYVRDQPTAHPSVGRVDLLPFILQNRESLVLKPANETRGAGVTIGHSVDFDTWRARVASAVDREWVVQAYCALPTSPSVRESGDECLVQDWQYSLDIFMFGGRAVGLTSRSNLGDVINVGSGGMRRPVCVVR